MAVASLRSRRLVTANADCIHNSKQSLHDKTIHLMFFIVSLQAFRLLSNLFMKVRRFFMSRYVFCNPPTACSV